MKGVCNKTGQENSFLNLTWRSFEIKRKHDIEKSCFPLTLRQKKSILGKQVKNYPLVFTSLKVVVTKFTEVCSSSDLCLAR